MKAAPAPPRLPELPRPGQRVRWRNPRDARAWGWAGLFGPGPFEVVRAVARADPALAADVVVRTRLGERAIPEVWLALADGPTGGTRGRRRGVAG
jgi:hypothetical protein